MPDARFRPENDVESVLADLDSLAARLGSPVGLGGLTGRALPLPFAPVRDGLSLRRFLEQYVDTVLAPLELPFILQARELAARGAHRELIRLDRRVHKEMVFEYFARPSRRTGFAQLTKLLPLRDQRVVQRYWRAVRAKKASGWHVIVYGMILGIYSLPLRQGLVHYATQTVHGLGTSACRTAGLEESVRAEITDDIAARFPALIDRVIEPHIQLRLLP